MNMNINMNIAPGQIYIMPGQIHMNMNMIINI